MGEPSSNATKSSENEDPIRNTFQEQRQNHNDHAECSRQDCSNGELMGMLMYMRQEMKERDD